MRSTAHARWAEMAAEMAADENQPATPEASQPLFKRKATTYWDETEASTLGASQPTFKRELTTYTNFAVTFNVMSVIATITSCLQLSWNYGGPASCTYSWLVSTLASWALGLSMAEITSALPSCGGPYFWACVLGDDYGRFLGFVTGWFSLFGEAALVGAAAASLVAMLSSLMQVNYESILSPSEQLGIYAGCLLIAGAINSLPGRILANITAWGFFWMFCSIIIVVLTLPSVAPWHQSAHFIWATFNDYHVSTTGIQNNVYPFLEGCMVAQYCVIGYDACAHMSEETVGAQRSVPHAIILSVVVSAVLGFIYLMALLLCIQDPNNLMKGNADGLVAAQIFYDAFKARYGVGTPGTIMMVLLPGSACFLCLLAIILSGSRMAFSFTRSGGVPYGHFFARVNSYTHTPLRTIWLLVFLAFLLGLPLLKSMEAFGMVASMANIALLISYAIPITCRLTISRHSFACGPFSLGSYSAIIGWTGVGWVALSSVIFVLPTAYPVTTENLNYAPIILGAMFLACVSAWYPPKWGGKNWFTGPKIPQNVQPIFKAQN